MERFTTAPLVRFAPIASLADDECEVVMSTGALARDGHILEPRGAQLDNYRANPIVLWQHDQSAPVGRASDIRVAGNNITAKIKFAPLGVSATADEVRRLVKSGIVSAVSVSFDPLEGKPLDPKHPWGGQRFTSWELLECSFVSVPADTGAVVAARALEILRSGKTLSAKTKASLRAALAHHEAALSHHRAGMQCQRDLSAAIGELLARDDDMGGGDDGGDRSRARQQQRLRLAQLRAGPVGRRQRLLQLRLAAPMTASERGNVHKRLRQLRASAPG